MISVVCLYGYLQNCLAYNSTVVRVLLQVYNDTIIKTTIKKMDKGAAVWNIYYLSGLNPRRRHLSEVF